jgi:hypothetical protein
MDQGHQYAMLQSTNESVGAGLGEHHENALFWVQSQTPFHTFVFEDTKFCSGDF